MHLAPLKITNMKIYIFYEMEYFPIHNNFNKRKRVFIYLKLRVGFDFYTIEKYFYKDIYTVINN